MVNSRIASYMPGGDITKELGDEANNWVYSDPRMRELIVMQHLQMDDLASKHAMGRIRLISALLHECKQLREENNANQAS